MLNRRVRITAGSWSGYYATVIELAPRQARVRLEHSGGYHLIDRRYLQLTD